MNETIAAPQRDEQQTADTQARTSPLRDRFKETRRLSIDLVAPLAPEDYRIQSMPDVSPPWWNLGHTTWFFAKNILEPRAGYRFPSPGFEYVLNSYYEAHGERLARSDRGSVSRPTTDEVLKLRRDVDRRMLDLLDRAAAGDSDPDLDFLVETGIQHEQQHQELLLTEIKHILGCNERSLRSPYCVPRSATEQSATEQSTATSPKTGAADLEWLPSAGGLHEFGHLGGGWCWDNETPVHLAYNAPFEIASRPVTVGELLDFIDDGGYRQPLLWLANGWQQVQSQGWQAPLYWHRRDGEWQYWTLAGDRPLDRSEPVIHASYYEADAYANWLAANNSSSWGARLPTEHEWEQAARELGFAVTRGTFLEDARYHPRSLSDVGPAADGSGCRTGLNFAGEVWEWTSSHYEPYPGYRPFAGALMEYNGKFMDKQRVLRGGSCATPRSHIRVSYRNFWPAETRFQFTGIRLARSLESSPW